MTTTNVIQAIADQVRRMRTRLDAVVSRAVIELVNDSLKTQRLQLSILADELVDDVEHMQPYGLSFTPPRGAEVLALCPGGHRGHTIAICAQLPGDRPRDAPAHAGGLYTKGAWRLYIDEAGVVTIGADVSTEHAVLGDTLVQLLQGLTVPTAMGPSGTPLNAAQYPTALSQHKVAP